MSANSSSAFLCETADGRSPRDGDPLSPSVYGTANRIVVSGSPCRVGEVNCVVVSVDAQTFASLVPRIGSTKLIVDDSVNDEFVQIQTTYAPVTGGLASNEDTPFSDTFAPWNGKETPTELNTFATHLGTSLGEYFVSRLTSSIDGEIYANTWNTFSLLLVYAGEGRVAAGYHDGSGVVMYATSGMPADDSYKDAKPLRTPVFSIEQTSAPSRPIGFTTTQPMGINSATANRVGALDRKSSPTTAGPATYEPRQTNICDNNSFTFAQRKVDRSFLQDSPFWKYDTKVRLTIPEQSVSSASFGTVSLSATPGEGNVFAGSWTAEYQDLLGAILASFGGFSIFDGVRDIIGPQLQTAALLPGGLISFPSPWLTGVDLSLSHELNDGTKTFPSEWHCFTTWNRSTYSTAAPNLNWSRNVSHVFRTQGSTAATLVPTEFSAQQTVNALNSFPWSSYYVLGRQDTRTPKTVQASFYIIQTTASSVVVSARLRFTWEARFVISRAFYSLLSANFTRLDDDLGGNPLAGTVHRVDAAFGYGSQSVACTRSYAGVGNVGVTEIVPMAKWKQFAQGGQIEITDGNTGAKCSIQLQSA